MPRKPSGIPTAQTVSVEVPANSPILPPTVTQEEAWAIQAFLRGKASEAEQGFVSRFILGRLSDISSLPLYTNDRDQNIALGRRYPGHYLLQIGQMKPEQIAALPRITGGFGREDDEILTS